MIYSRALYAWVLQPECQWFLLETCFSKLRILFSYQFFNIGHNMPPKMYSLTSGSLHMYLMLQSEVREKYVGSDSLFYMCPLWSELPICTKWAVFPEEVMFKTFPQFFSQYVHQCFTHILFIKFLRIQTKHLSCKCSPSVHHVWTHEVSESLTVLRELVKLKRDAKWNEVLIKIADFEFMRMLIVILQSQIEALLQCFH